MGVVAYLPVERTAGAVVFSDEVDNVIVAIDRLSSLGPTDLGAVVVMPAKRNRSTRFAGVTIVADHQLIRPALPEESGVISPAPCVPVIERLPLPE